MTGKQDKTPAAGPRAETAVVAEHDLIAADPRAPWDVAALARGLPQIATMAVLPPPVPVPAPEPDQPAGGDHAAQAQGSSRARARDHGGGTATGETAEPGGSGNAAGR